MAHLLFGSSHRFIRRDFLAMFIPIAATLSVATIGSAFLLSSLFMSQTMRILEENEASRLRHSIGVFSRIHFDGVPAFLSAMEEDPIRDYLYSRERSTERLLRGLVRLDRAMVGNEFTDSLYLYNERVGFLSTRSGFEGLSKPSDPDLSSFLSRVRDYGLFRYVPRKVAFEGDIAPRNLFTLVLGLMPAEGAAIHYAFVANLSERAIRAALTDDKAPGSMLYILDAQGDFLSHPKAAYFATSSVGDRLFDAVRARGESSGSMVVRSADGARHIVCWADQSELRWRFVSAAREDELFAPVMRVRNAVVALSFLVLLSAIAAVFLLSARMSGRTRLGELALAFLLGETDADELTASRLFPSIRFPALVAALRVDDYRSLVAGRDASALHDFRDELLDVLVPRVGPCEVMRLTEDTFLVLVAGDRLDTPETLREAASAAGQRLGASIGGYLAAGPRGADELPQARRELVDALRLDFLRPRGSICLAVPAVAPNGPAAADFDLTRLEKAFRLDDIQNANRQVDSLAAMLREAADPALFRYAVSALSVRIPATFGADAEELLHGGAEGFREALSGCDRLDEASQILRSAASRLPERGLHHGERRQRELIARVKDIVDLRLSDRSLGTAAIASEVGLSSSYLRELFKKREGIALLEYVGKARMVLAKRLLTETPDSVRSVCDQAGFISYSYFFTYFKKMTGCTPSEYREGERPRE